MNRGSGVGENTRSVAEALPKAIAGGDVGGGASGASGSSNVANPDGQLLTSGASDHVIKIWKKVPGFTEESPAGLLSYSSSSDSPRRLDTALGRPQDLPD